MVTWWSVPSSLVLHLIMTFLSKNARLKAAWFEYLFQSSSASEGVFTWYRYEFHFVSHMGSHFTGITLSFLWALVLTSHFGALLTIDTHSLPVPVNSATHLVPERNLVPPLHDTGTECGQISYRYERFVPVSCKRIQSYKWEPGWTRTGIM